MTQEVIAVIEKLDALIERCEELTDVNALHDDPCQQAWVRHDGLELKAALRIRLRQGIALFLWLRPIR